MALQLLPRQNDDPKRLSVDRGVEGRAQTAGALRPASARLVVNG